VHLISDSMKNDRTRVLLALLALYFIWGSTFLAIRIALQGIPPLLVAGMRYVIAGGALYGYARLRGLPSPARAEWKSAFVVGTLLVSGNACVVVAEQWVSSGVAAVALASMPIWVALVAGLFGKWPTGSEWVGLAIGLAGVAVLQTAGDLQASPRGALVLVLSCASWSLGSILGTRLRLPHGLMSSAAQMLAGGAMVLAAAVLRGERLVAPPPPQAVGALAYLIVFGSIIAYSAYQFLLKAVRPTLAASYSYVNPIVALALGALVMGEAIPPRAIFALGMILGGVALLALRANATAREPQVE
jgi:drug/metabolite transporter (DMT)-like permease